jgi:hypothetical protein
MDHYDHALVSTDDGVTLVTLDRQTGNETTHEYLMSHEDAVPIGLALVAMCAPGAAISCIDAVWQTRTSTATVEAADAEVILAIGASDALHMSRADALQLATAIVRILDISAAD